MKRSFARVVNAVLIIAGIFSAAFGLKGFLLSSHFIDGGVTGISMLVWNIFGIPLPLLLVVFNVPFIIFGYKNIGRDFAVKSSCGIVGLALCLAFVSFPDVTPDKLLTAVFGGLFIGAGIGLAIRGGSVLDGTEIAALWISRRSYLFHVGDVILIVNVVIFITAAFFISVESAMYSILTYVAATKAIDFLVHGVEEYTAITIVSAKSDEIREAIARRHHRGVTVLRGRGGVGSTGAVEADRDVLYCVVTRLEIGVIKSAIGEIDDQAFVTTHTLTDVEGGLMKKQILH
jgi:uncharacterized membrane-anchored protein YitT (DUF2179 family)